MRRSIVRRQNSLIIYGANLLDRDKPKIEDFNPSIDLQLSEKEFVDKYIYGIGRQRVTNRAMLKMFYRHWKRKELKENPMAGNAALFKKANALMRKGYTRKQAFAALSTGPKRATRKTVKKNPSFKRGDYVAFTPAVIKRTGGMAKNARGVIVGFTGPHPQVDFEGTWQEHENGGTIRTFPAAN